MQQLNIVGKRTHFRLKTMGPERVVPYSLFGIEVSSIEGQCFYPLPVVLTQKEMPVSPDDIATTADLERWPYSSKCHIPSIDASVDLLIGTNAPRLQYDVLSAGAGRWSI